ncbi:MAG TPA: ABC transporter permease [Candidatus Limnocylindrales bacterium]|nr:ABC transporter permease [Candidatus Limnocylindrales bacterium]
MTAAPTAAPAQRRRLGLGAGILVLPGVVWLGIFFLFPLALIAVISLGAVDPNSHITLANPNLHNYADAVKAEYLPAFGRSIYYSVMTTILSLGIGYPVAYWISRYGGRRKILLLILVMLPFWTSYLIRTYAWMIILRDNGVINSVLLSAGFISHPLRLLNTDLSVILGMTYGFLPFAILPLYVSIDRLDHSLVQAGRDLYASGRGAFLHVTLPLTMPGLIAAGLLTFIPALGDYVTPDVLGGAQTNTISNIVQTIFLSGRDWPAGSALGFLLMAVTIAGTLLALRSLRSEVIGT